ncbi:MAG: type II toxin-antitoxin system RelE/ParE family toxin [Gemmatimonadaceae bacterium]|nr:type II toxin-antitoxin system RelE/ParE family toxin [Gemmatimonadaceae bacterium]
MIRSFRHKGLRRYFTEGERKGIDAKHEPRIRRLLDRLDAATCPEDMNLPGFEFHPLKGAMRGTFAVSVSGNWRITFAFEDGDPIDVNLEDYH